MASVSISSLTGLYLLVAPVPELLPLLRVERVLLRVLLVVGERLLQRLLSPLALLVRQLYFVLVVGGPLLLQVWYFISGGLRPNIMIMKKILCFIKGSNSIC